MTLDVALLALLLGYLAVGAGAIGTILALCAHVRNLPRGWGEWLSVVLAWVLWPLFLWYVVEDGGPQQGSVETPFQDY